MAGPGAAKLGFHLCLGAILLPVAAVPAELALGLYHLARSPRGSDGRRWAFRLLGLSVVDLVVAVALVLFVASGARPPAPHPMRPPSAATRDGAAHPTRGLFAPSPPPGGRAHGGSRVDRIAVAAVGACGLLLGVVLLFARRHRGAAPTLAAALAILLFAFGAGTGSLILLDHGLGGFSVGAVIVSLLVQSCAMLAAALVCRRWLARRGAFPVEPGPHLAIGRALALGALYLVSGWARIALVLVALQSLIERSQGQAGEVMALLGAERYGVGGALLLVGTVAIAAPIAEEMLFRGLILPSLAGWMSQRRALWLSACLFALLHIPSHGIGALVVLVTGLVLGWLRLSTGGLRASMVLHALNNGAAVTALLWASSRG